MRNNFEEKSGQGLPEVGFLIPETEMTSDRVLNILLPQISQYPIKPVFYFVDQPADSRYELHPDLKTLGFMEKKLMAEVVNPFVREQVANGTQPNGTYLPLDLLSEKHGGRTLNVANLNDPDFVKSEVTDKAVPQDLFMIRQRTIAKLLADACEEKKSGMLMNIHPAKLPGIRGLMGTFWSRIDAMDNGINSCSVTMHKINDHEIDKGPITDFAILRVDPEIAVGTETVMAAPAIADMIKKEIEIRLLHAGNRSITVPQVANDVYRTVPTPEEIEDAKENYGIRLVDTEEMLDYILDHYSSEAHPEHRQKLEYRCRKAIGEHNAIVSAKFGLSEDGCYETPVI